MRDIEKYAENYAALTEDNKFEIKYQVFYRRKKVLEQIRKYQPKAILEIGCGMDSYGNYLEDFERYIVIEPSKTFSDQAKKDLMDKRNTKVYPCSLEDSVKELEGEEFDFIIASGILHEVENPIEFLKELHSLCSDRKKTIVHINTLNQNSFHRILALESGMIKNTDAKSERNKLLQQKTVFNLNTLKEMICTSYHDKDEMKKVKILDEGSYFIKPFTHEQMMKSIENGIISQEILEGFYRIEKYMPGLGSEIFVNYTID